ncbi:hypothetical protein JOF56_002118 [Kibdelosporangium banguiense]|uniref:Uncharacterized protein n=1 Tax=Kibdelosporangium banguiense TaxID=1365924 RepID=A0ABS4TBF0_9PSEU|nr:hypothetical protein [Kibdelosporangium banguiense]MBP2321733.1 hypothetical protein [Kibdelosporangium banguiense]
MDDEKLIQALRREVDGPAPTVHTQLSDIVPRGLRRRRIRQASSIAAAVAVVVGIGFAATAFDGQPLSNEPAKTPVVEIPTTVPLTADWGRANLPAMTPISTWKPDAGKTPIPGVPAAGLPQCAQGNMPPGPDPKPASMAPGVQQLLLEALREVAKPAEVGGLVERRPSPDEPVYWADIKDRAGTATIRVWPETTPASPLVTADYQAFFENNCQPPKRVVKPDGSVMQIYEIRPAGSVMTQTMRIYLPDHRMYTVMAHNYVPGSGPGDFLVTRPGPVLTEYQLAKLGEALMSP